MTNASSERPVRDARGRLAVGLGVLLTAGPRGSGTWASAPDDFATLEAAGCSAVWIADHLFWGAPMPEAFVMASLAVAGTEQCVIGTGVLQLPMRNTAAVAKAAATLQVASRGRFVLGVGSGEHAEEYERVGTPFARRGRRLDAAIPELRRLWRGDGERFSQRPVPPSIPIWAGGRSPHALERAARLADGWLPLFVTVEQFARANDDLDARLAAAERPASAVARGVVVIVAPHRTGHGRDDALDWMEALWRLDRDRLGRYLVSGSAEACAAALQDYRDAGADHVAVLVADDDATTAFARIAEQSAR